MSFTMHIYNDNNTTISEYYKAGYNSVGFDVSEIVHDIDYTTSILGQAGKLTFTLEKDPNDEFQFGVGSLVKFWHSDNENEPEKPVFMGNVFSIGMDKNESCRVVAYDQTRYLQNHEDYVINSDDMKNMEDVFQEICKTYGFKYGYQYTKPDAKNYILTYRSYLEDQHFVDVSAFDILNYCMNFSSKNNSTYVNPELFKDFNDDQIGQYYYLRDDFGTIKIHEILCDFLFDEDGNSRKDFLIIGDESLLTDFKYDIDIDKETYNEFFFRTTKEKTKSNSSADSSKNVDEKELIMAIQAGAEISNSGTSLDGTTIGEDTIPKWGKLRKFVEVKNLKKQYSLSDYAKAVVEHYNKPTRSIKITAIGYDGLYAGNSFIFSLKKLKIDYPVYVISATHHYNGDLHTMDLEINTNPKIEVLG